MYHTQFPTWLCLPKRKKRPLFSCTTTRVLVVLLAEITELSLKASQLPERCSRHSTLSRCPLCWKNVSLILWVSLEGNFLCCCTLYFPGGACLQQGWIPVLSQPPALATMNLGRADGRGAAAASLPRVVCTQAGGACRQLGLRSKRGCLLGAEEVLVPDRVLQKQVTHTYIAQPPDCFPRAAAAALGRTVWKQKCSNHCFKQNLVFILSFKTYLTA